MWSFGQRDEREIQFSFVVCTQAVLPKKRKEHKLLRGRVLHIEAQFCGQKATPQHVWHANHFLGTKKWIRGMKSHKSLPVILTRQCNSVNSDRIVEALLWNGCCKHIQFYFVCFWKVFVFHICTGLWRGSVMPVTSSEFTVRIWPSEMTPWNCVCKRRGSCTQTCVSRVCMCVGVCARFFCVSYWCDWGPSWLVNCKCCRKCCTVKIGSFCFRWRKIFRQVQQFLWVNSRHVLTCWTITHPFGEAKRLIQRDRLKPRGISVIEWCRFAAHHTTGLCRWQMKWRHKRRNTFCALCHVAWHGATVTNKCVFARLQTISVSVKGRKDFSLNWYVKKLLARANASASETICTWSTDGPIRSQKKGQSNSERAS